MVDTIFLYSAIIGGTVLAFQLGLMLLGFGDGGDHDFSGGDVGDVPGGLDLPDGDLSSGVDSHHHPTWAEAGDADLGHPGAHWFYEVLSLRTLGAAVTFFGLAGKTAQGRGMTDVQALVVGLIAGAASMYAVYWLFKQVYKVEHAGNEDVRGALGVIAKVYVPIPARGAGSGKVMFRLQDRTVEYLAVTEESERLRTGEDVIITGVLSVDTVCVSRAWQPANASTS